MAPLTEAEIAAAAASPFAAKYGQAVDRESAHEITGARLANAKAAVAAAAAQPGMGGMGATGAAGGPAPMTAAGRPRSAGPARPRR
jgi:hypothetical protein